MIILGIITAIILVLIIITPEGGIKSKILASLITIVTMSTLALCMLRR